MVCRKPVTVRAGASHAPGRPGSEKGTSHYSTKRQQALSSPTRKSPLRIIANTYKCKHQCSLTLEADGFIWGLYGACFTGVHWPLQLPKQNSICPRRIRTFDPATPRRP
jgi:hypothetical protein